MPLMMGVYGYLAMIATGCYAVVRGSTIRGLAVRLFVLGAITAAGTVLVTGTSTSAFGLSVPLCEFFFPFDLFPSYPLHFLILSRKSVQKLHEQKTTKKAQSEQPRLKPNYELLLIVFYSFLCLGRSTV
jgi:hypothetical protein